MLLYKIVKRFLCQILDIHKTFLSNTIQILDISHIHLSFKGVLQYIAYNVHYAWQQHNLLYSLYIYHVYICVYYHITCIFIR